MKNEKLQLENNIDTKTSPQKVVLGYPKAEREQKMLFDKLNDRQAELETMNRELIGTQKELKASLMKYIDLYACAPIGYITVSAYGTVIEANITAASMLGMKWHEMIRKPMISFVIPEDQSIYSNNLSMLLATGDAQVCEFRLATQEKGPFWVWIEASLVWDDKDKVFGSRIAMKDISERKKAEEALRRSEEKFRMVADWTYDWEYWISPEGVILYASPSMERITGYPVEFLTDDPGLLDNFVHPLDRQLWESHIGNQERGENREACELEFRIISRNGDTCWIHHICRPVFAKDGHYMGRRISNRDVTEKKQMEERIQKLEKFQALGRIAGSVAHDLNNVLGIVFGYLELLMMNADKNGPTQKYLKAIWDSSNEAATIVKDLLIMARKGVVVHKPLNLNTVVADYLTSSGHGRLVEVYPHICIGTNLEPRLMKINGSENHLNRVIMDLVVNAVEAIHGDGTVTISTKTRCLDVPLSGYEQISAGTYVVLSISDTGRGISSENMKDIFEPFYSTKHKRQSGSGLGLPAVWGVVKNHNGYIDVISEQRKETIFELYFPAIFEDLSECPVQKRI